MNKVLFVQEHMYKILKDMRFPITDILDIKLVDTYRDKTTYDKNVEEVNKEYGEEIGYLRNRIGKYDFTTMIEVDRVFNNLLLNNGYNAFLSNFEQRDWNYNMTELGGYNDVANKIHNLLLKTGDDLDSTLDFKDTYTVEITVDGNFIVRLKEGFTNFVNNGKANKKVLLDEIVDMVPKEDLFGSSGVVILSAYRKLL